RVAAGLERTAHRLGRAKARHTGWDAFGPGVRRTYAQGAKALAALGDHPSDEALHTFRKRAKDLWYQLRLLEPTWPAVLGSLVAVAAELASALGDDHDLAVLAAVLDDHDLDLRGKVRRRIGALVTEERARLQATARTIGARLYADHPDAWEARLNAWWSASRDR
ncbi:MAG TPA: CHAD domain-containing protein, partial [Acidimicrobiales bacterium]